jgi:hypothetical protein
VAQLKNTTTHAGHTIKIVFKPDGAPSVEVGRGQGLQARRGFRTTGVYEIGSIYPVEHLALQYEGSITMQRWLVRKDVLGQAAASLKDSGVQATGTGEGDVDSDGVARGGDIMRLPLLDIEVYDKFTGEIIRAYRRCTPAEYSESFNANALAGENSTWLYLYSE